MSSAQKCPECGAWWVWPTEHRCPPVVTSTGTFLISPAMSSTTPTSRLHDPVKRQACAEADQCADEQIDGLAAALSKVREVVDAAGCMCRGDYVCVKHRVLTALDDAPTRSSQDAVDDAGRRA